MYKMPFDIERVYKPSHFLLPCNQFHFRLTASESFQSKARMILRQREALGKKSNQSAPIIAKAIKLGEKTARRR
jgi:hypothetical protein